MPKHTFMHRLTPHICSAFILFVLPFTAFAQSGGVDNKLMSGIATVVTSIIAGLNLLTWVIFLFLTILLDPNFIFNQDGTGELMTILNSIWILSRDIVNIAFAFLLIGAALYTIITANKDFITQHLKNFVLTIILVNFSWFIPRVIIDIGNVAAATVYGIPSLIATQGGDNACTFSSSKLLDGHSCTLESAGNYSCKCAVVVNAQFFIDAKDRSKFSAANGWKCPLGDVLCIKLQDLNVDTVAGYSAVLNGLIVNHARLEGLATVPPSLPGQSPIKAMIFFLLRQAVVLAIHVALFFPLAAILLAFAIRIPVLWLTIAFMPFVVFKFILPSNYTGELPEKIWDNFLKAAFLPAIVGVPLTIGFIMINAGSNIVSKETDFSVVNIKLTDTISDFWELLWVIMALGVIWVGVFETIGKMGIMAKGSEFIKQTGESIGRLALKTPLSVPFIPGPGGSSTSLLQSAKMLNPRVLESALDQTGDIKKAFDQVKSGKADNNRKIQDYTRQFSGGAKTPELVKLNDQLEDLKKAFEARDPDAAERRNKIINDIKQRTSIQIDVNNPNEILDVLATELRTARADGGQADRTKNIADGIRTAASASRAATPAAPPAGTTTTPPAGSGSTP